MTDLTPSPTDGNDDLRVSVDRLADNLADLRVAVDEESAARREQADELRTKQVTAQQAVDAAADATAEVQRLVRKLRSLVRVMAVAGLAAVGALALGYWVRENDRTDALITNCRNGNEFRAALERRFEQFADRLAAMAPPGSDEARAVRDAQLASFLAEFHATLEKPLQPRDCSVKAVLAPAPLPTAGG